MAEWLYREAGQIDVPDEDLWMGLYCGGALTPAAKAFVANVANIKAIWKIHPHLIEQASINVARLCETIWQLTGNPLLTGSESNFTELSAEVCARITERFKKRYAETGSVEEAAGYDFVRGLERFEALVEKTNNPDLKLAVFATLAGQISWGWTAFEALATDLWEIVSQRRPELKAQDHLQSQWGIQKAFQKLQSDEIDNLLNKPCIRKLSLVRQVIVHKAAIVDQKFLDDARAIPWEVRDQLECRILLDGERVRNLINPVVALGVSLLGAVARWLNSNP